MVTQLSNTCSYNAVLQYILEKEGEIGMSAYHHHHQQMLIIRGNDGKKRWARAIIIVYKTFHHTHFVSLPLEGDGLMEL